MLTTIQTPTGQLTLQVCRDNDADTGEWIHLYEVSFPHGQRQSLGEIQGLLRKGTMELDETRDQDGHVLCMTITEVLAAPPGPPFLLACYTATLPAMRCLGIGSLHRRRLKDLLQEEYPDFLGIVGEIESTLEEGLSPEVLQLRRRRKAFFLRLGHQPLPVRYLFPSFVPGERPIQGELLFTPFHSGMPDPKTLRQMLMRIYTEAYGLDPADPLIPQVLAQFGG